MEGVDPSGMTQRLRIFCHSHTLMHTHTLRIRRRSHAHTSHLRRRPLPYLAALLTPPRRRRRRRRESSPPLFQGPTTLVMSQWAAMLEANKENIPYPIDLADQKPTVSSSSDADALREIDVDVDVTTIPHHSALPPSPPLSQKSNVSVHSQGEYALTPFEASRESSSRLRALNIPVTVSFLHQNFIGDFHTLTQRKTYSFTLIYLFIHNVDNILTRKTNEKKGQVHSKAFVILETAMYRIFSTAIS